MEVEQGSSDGKRAWGILEIIVRHDVCKGKGYQ